MGSSVEVLEPVLDEVAFDCPECGKRYVTERHNAGRRIRCRRCGWRVRVPGRRARSGRVSERTRAAVLAELGLDPAQAEADYWRRQLGSCTDTPIPRDDEPPEAAEPSLEVGAGPRVQLEIAQPGLTRSLGYWAFVSLGGAGFLHTVCRLPLEVSLPLAALVAALGARAVFAAASRSQGAI